LALRPGDFIQAKSSLKSLAGRSGRAAIVLIAVLTSPMATKSFSASKV
jgi:hypothetical protein